MTKCQSSQAATEHFVFLFIQFHHKADIPDCHPYAGSASSACAEKQLFGRQIPSLAASLAAASIQNSELCVLAAAAEKYLRLSAAAAAA